MYEGIKKYSKQENQQLDDLQDVGSMQMRGRDFRQMAAAFLYNVTGDTEWEKIMAEESMVKTPQSQLFSKGKHGFFGVGVMHEENKELVPFCQYWAAAAYLVCPQERHYSELYTNLKSVVAAQAGDYNISNAALRPSRRAANDSRWQTSQNLQLVMLAHFIADKNTRRQLEHIMYTEAAWSLGRNPGNIVEMTGLGERHITDVYSTGRNDGDPGTHPGQTPFNGTETWSAGHNGGDARVILKYCYPDWNDGGWHKNEGLHNMGEYEVRCLHNHDEYEIGAGDGLERNFCCHRYLGGWDQNKGLRSLGEYEDGGLCDDDQFKIGTGYSLVRNIHSYFHNRRYDQDQCQHRVVKYQGIHRYGHGQYQIRDRYRLEQYFHSHQHDARQHEDQYFHGIFQYLDNGVQYLE